MAVSIRFVMINALWFFCLNSIQLSVIPQKIFWQLVTNLPRDRSSVLSYEIPVSYFVTFFLNSMCFLKLESHFVLVDSKRIGRFHKTDQLMVDSIYKETISRIRILGFEMKPIIFLCFLSKCFFMVAMNSTVLRALDVFFCSFMTESHFSKSTTLKRNQTNFLVDAKWLWIILLEK